MPSSRTDHWSPTYSRPWRGYRGPIRDASGRTAQPFLGAQTRRLPFHTPHPTVLARHPNTTPTGKQPQPTDAYRCRAVGVIVITRPDLTRPQIHLRPPRPLAPYVQVHFTSARGTPLIQGWRRPVVPGQEFPSRHPGPPFGNTMGPLRTTYIIRFLEDPRPNKIKLRSASYTTSSLATYSSWC